MRRLMQVLFHANNWAYFSLMAAYHDVELRVLQLIQARRAAKIARLEAELAAIRTRRPRP